MKLVQESSFFDTNRPIMQVLLQTCDGETRVLFGAKKYREKCTIKHMSHEQVSCPSGLTGCNY